MKSQLIQERGWIGVLVWSMLMLGLLSGCDDSRYDYTPPEGMGALIIENYTGDAVLVYIDGEQLETVSIGGEKIYDVLPGVRRVAVDSEEIRRSWAGDVDILEGRRTIMELRGDSFELEVFDVRLFFD